MNAVSPLIEGLNDIQTEAVLHTEGPVLIVAGAGSGKTRALTHRIAYLIREEGVSPGQILAITFTNKAAREMVERVEELLGERVAKGMWILTFHSTCARLLRREHDVPGGAERVHDLRRRRHRAADRRQVLKDLDLDPKRFAPRAMASGISRAKDQVLGPDEFAQMAANYYEETVAKVFAAYEPRKKAAGALDFDDLISETVRLFRDHPEVLAHYQERFRYLMVDEYQDTNRAQYELVNMLSREVPQRVRRGRRRPGRVQLARRHDPEHPGLRARLPRRAVFLMEQNYRSTQNILEIANALIEHNQQRKPKACGPRPARATSPCGSAPRTSTTRRCSSPTRSNACREPRATATRDFAIFYRTNAQSRVLEDVFMRIGVPYRVFGGVRFYQRKEIKDVLAYLRLLVNPRRRDQRSAAWSTRRSAGSATPRWRPSSRSRATRASRSCEAALRVDEIAALASAAKGAVARVPPDHGRRSITTWTTAPAPRAWSSSPPSSPATWRSSRRSARSRRRVGSRTSRSSSGVAAELDAREPEADLERVPRAGLAGRRAGRVRRGRRPPSR